MTAPMTDPHALAAERERLHALSLDELKARWLALKGVPLPKFMRRARMPRALARAIEESAPGGLDPATAKRLEQLARQIVPAGRKPPPAPNRIKAGTRLVRAWKGRVHEVSVVPGGFVWNGERHRSLSRIAGLITGTRWNGWVFFGLKRSKEAGASPPPRSREVRRSSKPGRRDGPPDAREASHA